MLNTIYEVMLHTRKRVENCWVDVAHSKEGEYEIKNGMITLPFLVEGQYFMISGSYFNDGVYQYYSSNVIDGLQDEKSTFYVVSIKPPRSFIALCDDIDEWKDKYSSGAESPFTSESFDGYSYQKKSGENGSDFSWKDAFKSRLDIWRML